MTTPAPSTMRRDLASAYLASAAKIGSWVIVSAIVYRRVGAEGFAMLALVRATVGLLSYTTLGLGPAVVHFAARAAEAVAAPKYGVVAISEPIPLSYAQPAVAPSTADVTGDPVHRLFINALVLAGVSGSVGFLLSYVYAFLAFNRIHEVPLRVAGPGYEIFAFTMAIGIVFRYMSEPHGAMVQVKGMIALDNLLLVFTEIAWAVLAAVWVTGGVNHVLPVGYAFSVASLLLLISRAAANGMFITRRDWKGLYPNFAIISRLFWFGLLVSIGQLADFLYAPTDYILINLLISPTAVAAYAPAVQIDAGLLLLVTGLSAVLLPKAALAHAAGERVLVRQYYVRGTLSSAGILAVASALVWVLSTWIFRIWLGDPMAATQAILPLVLVHTVIGGSSAVGRSILLGMGKVKPFTIAAIVAGVANVVLSYCFVRFFGWGLYGIVAGTIVVVVARAGIWMPWYVLRTLRESEGPIEPADPMPPAEAPVG